MEHEVPFPQADDFEKILKIIQIPVIENLNSTAFMKDYLGITTDRQVSYYISAATYLGLLSKAREFTELGSSIRGLNEAMQKVELIRLLFTDEVFGRVYIAGKLTNSVLSKDKIAEIIHASYPDYSEAIYNRRAQTVVSWINWIDKEFNK